MMNMNNKILVTLCFFPGSNHADDVSYVFGYPLFNHMTNWTSDDVEVARYMVTTWTNFAKYG